MDAKTLEALKGSIEKWRRIVEEGAESHGSQDCPLCDLFNYISGCGRCPVAQKTRMNFCKGSPHNEWERLRMQNPTRSADTPEKLLAARAELEFLRSLLPAEEGPAGAKP